MSSAPDSRLVIGVGHAERQDDAVGPHVAEALQRRGLPAVVHAGDGAGLLDLWDSQETCLVIDAIADPAAPGRILTFTDFDAPAFARTGFVHSTHRLGLPEAVALGRTLGRMPGRLVVIGITGTAFGFGSQLSPAVASAAEHLIDGLATAEEPLGDDAFADLNSD